MVWSCGGCNDPFPTEAALKGHYRRGPTPACARAAAAYFSSIQQRPYRRDAPRRRSHRRQSPSALPAGPASRSPSPGSAHSTRAASPASQPPCPSDALGPDLAASPSPQSSSRLPSPASPEPVTASAPPEEAEDRPASPFRDYYGNDYTEDDFPFDNGPVQRELSDASYQAPAACEGSDDEDDVSAEADAVGRDTVDGESGSQADHTVHVQMHIEPSSVHAPLPADTVMEDFQHPPPPREGTTGASASAVPGGVDPSVHDQLRREPEHVTHFGGLAGAPVHSDPSEPSELFPLTSGYKTYGDNVEGSRDNQYAPFRSELDWQIAQWAKMRSPTSNAFSELLAIKGLVEALGLSYKSTNELNTIIDEKLPHRRPIFSRFEAAVMGEKFEMYARPILECIFSLYRDPEHSRYLCFAPERHYADSDKTVRLYHDLHTGEWWWTVQRKLEAENPGATVVPIIISSDKTQVTLFRNKTAYPVYLTIGNLPKSIRQKPGRQGQILLAYLPTSRLDHITNKAARRCVLQNMFHACMHQLLEPLQSAGGDGIVMTSGDGVSRRCYPILAAYVGDYPEQCLVTCSYFGDCPVCECLHKNLSDYPSTHPLRDYEAALYAVKSLDDSPDDFAAACKEANIKPIQHPFWEDLPYLNIFQSITVDVLHQLYQGVFKHLVTWLKAACGTAELDARVARLPPNHSIRIFYKGISALSRVSGAEHRQISHFILGVILEMELPGGREVTAQLVRATRVLLDFIYMAQYPIHSTSTLNALEAALSAFHEDREIFVTLGVRTGFAIPKLHSLTHYVRCIKLFGTTDNYNTETSERLHIDFAKNAYRATNHKDEYPQMTKWLERREKIAHHANYILWREQQVDIGPRTLNAHHGIRWRPPDPTAPLQVKMTRNPTRKSVLLRDIVSPSQYGAQFFIPALARFVTQWCNPGYSARQVEYYAEDFITPFDRLPVFHRIKLWNEAVYGKETVDSVHVHPRSSDLSGDVIVPARFDTALIRVRTEAPSQPEPLSSGSAAPAWSGGRRNLTDMRVAQVRVVFTLPDKALGQLFPGLPVSQRPPRHLAYVEWFSRFTTAPDRNSRLYKVSRIVQDEQRVASILPFLGTGRARTSLKNAPSFYVNPFKDAHTFFNLY
ncbi:hypothetical protein BN946_scf184792.g4 [Trametes cinnabarina]|uniref:C2H2-type domain-containing protein n=1 Tax=Pycnoporus cinnabarinus TaxID=5643 RepID=A0A060SMR4_PYCCI|nr:hypothetical protein BN946_scf184792.g4 [Trametes cinnabarina]